MNWTPIVGVKQYFTVFVYMFVFFLYICLFYSHTLIYVKQDVILYSEIQKCINYKITLM